jgi:hypothetical protein
MPKTKRRSLEFDSLEGKVFLSIGMANPAVAVHRAVVKRISLTGSLTGVYAPAGSPDGIVVNAFDVKGTLGSLGKVKGVFTLASPFVPGGKPNLSNASLILSNKKGTVGATIGTSSTKFYDFVITSGTGLYAMASGSGVITLHFSRKVFDYVMMTLHSTRH